MTAANLAPYPKCESDVTATALANHQTVEAHAGLARSVDLSRTFCAAVKAGEPAEQAWADYETNAAVTAAQHGVAFLLRQLQQFAPEQADEIARTLWRHWEDGPLGGWTHQDLLDHGIDPESVLQAAGATHG
jgi:hypothetical protein